MSGPAATGLARFVGPVVSPPAPSEAPPVERCEMCGTVLAAHHDHLVELDSRALTCACRACALLFTNRGAGGGRYRPVPDRYRYCADFALSQVEWEELQIPVSVAFFFLNSDQDRWVAFYPSPAGATESVLPLEGWAGLLESNPVLAGMEPDVEALLIRRDGLRFACFLVPISDCYELVGLMRLQWRGFDGGEQVRDGIDAFFAGLAERSVRA